MKIAVIPDTHCPFHDTKSLALAIKVIKAFKPQILVHMGDLADFKAVSRYDKNPYTDRSFKHELAIVRQVRKRLDDLAPRKIFLCGNHEQRLENYLLQKAPALADYISIDQAIQLSENGWEYYPYQEVVTIGKLNFVHDLGFSGKYSLSQTMDAFPGNIIIAHTHRFEMRVRGNLKRDKMVGANFGWLGDSKAIDYLPSVKVKQDWTKGFGLIELDQNGNPHIEPVSIDKGKCVWRGKVFR